MPLNALNVLKERLAMGFVRISRIDRSYSKAWGIVIAWRNATEAEEIAVADVIDEGAVGASAAAVESEVVVGSQTVAD